MAIAENKMVLDPQPAHVVVDLTATILIRPAVVVHDSTGAVDATRSGMGVPQEITLAQLKALLA